MSEHASEGSRIDRTCRGQLAVLVAGHRGLVQDPIIDQRIAGPGVEGQERAVSSDPRHVGNTADIEECNRSFCDVGGHGTMIDRRERCPLSAELDIVGTQVINDGDAGLVGQELAIPKLHCEVLMRPVQHRLAVEADDIEIMRHPGVVRQKPRHGGAMQARQLDFDIAADARAVIPVSNGLDSGDRLTQSLAERRIVDLRTAGKQRQPIRTIGLDCGDVDAIHRGPAHQTNCPHCLAHCRRPVHGAPASACAGALRPVAPSPQPIPARSFDLNGFVMTDIDFTPKSEFLNILTERGYIHQCSDFAGLDELAANREVVCYVGYDCTAPSLHVGSLISIMMLHWLQQTGNTPIVLMGGGTTRVGDPSGRDESRQLLAVETIESNKETIKQVFAKFLTFDLAGPGTRMVDNAEWLTMLNYIEMLRDVGRHFSINRMLSMDSVRMRLEREQELSFIEFNYMILQAYDYVELARRYGCNLQMGGSDQWGNIVNGIDLGRRMGTHQLYALTCPLLTTASGAKMGKTASGAVWLNADMLSPYDYWQYWRNTEDADVERFLKLFTALPLDEIAKLGALGGAEINDAKKVLATEATALLHGRDAADRAAETAQQTFERGTLAAGLPTVELARSDLSSGLGILSAFVIAGLTKSNGEARRQLKGGGLRVNDNVIADDKATLSEADLGEGGVIKLSFGKKRHVLLKPI